MRNSVPGSLTIGDTPVITGRGGSGARLFGTIFLLLGGALSAWGVVELARALRMRSWPTAPGRVTASYVSTDNVGIEVGKYQNHTVYARRGHVSYRYEVGGQSYLGSRVDQLAPSTRRPSADSARYPEGRAVTVRYDPVDPADAVLEVTWPTGGTFALLLGLPLAAAGWRERRRPRTRRRATWSDRVESSQSARLAPDYVVKPTEGDDERSG